MINNVLTHRATIERNTYTMEDGSPVMTWAVIGVRVPVLFSKDSAEFDPTWTATQRREADQRGTLFALPGADIQPGDRVTLTRPMDGGKFEVLPDPSKVLTLHTIHHREYAVREVG